MNKYLPCGPLVKITQAELLALIDKSVHEQILEKAKRLQATHLVLFENQMFDSSDFGGRSVLCVGGNCSTKSPMDCEGQWLNDLPSQRRYAIKYCACDNIQ